MQILLGPGAGADAELAVDDLRTWYALDWLEPGGVRVNFIVSVDGAASAAGLSRGLQTPGDNRVFAALRDLADVILVGASTATAEGYEPIALSEQRRQVRSGLGLAPSPATAVLSGRLDVDLSSKLFSQPTADSPTLLLAGSTAPTGRRNDIIDLAANVTGLELLEIPAGDGGVDFAAAVARLNDLGYRRILCEGGPRLLSAAARSGAMTELCLSTSPVLLGPGAGRILVGEPWADDSQVPLELVGLLTEDGALFSRYRVSKVTR